MRVVRMRPALCFKRNAASGVRRLFVGPLPPRALMRPSRIPVVADIPGLRFQAVHTDDVAEAYRLALTSDVQGPINVAAEPVLDGATLADALGARTVRVPPGVAPPCWPRPGGCGSSRRRPGGWTWRSACR